MNKNVHLKLYGCVEVISEHALVITIAFLQQGQGQCSKKGDYKVKAKSSSGALERIRKLKAFI